MIVNLFGKDDGDGLKIQTPFLILDQRMSYKVAVLHINFRTIDTLLERHELLTLNSNLVNRTSLNPSQSIVLVPILHKNDTRNSSWHKIVSHDDNVQG